MNAGVEHNSATDGIRANTVLLVMEFIFRKGQSRDGGIKIQFGTGDNKPRVHQLMHCFRCIIFVFSILFYISGPTAGETKSVEVYFSKPGERVLIEKLGSLIEMAESGSRIDLAFYLLNDPSIIHHLENASKRGISLNLIVDSSKANDTIRKQSENLCNADTLDCIHTCTGSCLGNKGPLHLYEDINHLKIALFSKLSNGDQNLSVVTSSNMYSNSKNFFQDMVIINDDQIIYSYLLNHMDKMREEVPNAHSAEWLRGSTGVNVFLSPDIAGNQTPIIDALADLDCARSGTVRVAMSYFNDDRIEVAQYLALMKEKGCRIRVITGVYWDDYPTYTAPEPQVMNVLGDSLIKIETQLHMKLLLLEGTSKSTGESLHGILTGSHNFTKVSLTQNDEILISINDRELFSLYNRQYDAILRHDDGKSRDRTRKVHLYHLAHALRTMNKTRAERHKFDKDCFITTCRFDQNTSTDLRDLMKNGYMSSIPTDPKPTVTHYYYAYWDGKKVWLCANSFEADPKFKHKPYCTSV